MQFQEAVILLDSLGDIKTDNTCQILVCGSHCGDNGTFARKLKNCHVKAVFLNNAGIGKNQAGIRGLSHYQAVNILACAVDHHSAEIGVARDTWECGIISHTNNLADEAGIRVGDSVMKAVATIMNNAEFVFSDLPYSYSEGVNDVKDDGSAKVDQKRQSKIQMDGLSITITDSITFLNENNAGDIVVCGSHGGVSAGEYTLKHHVKAVFFNDAGIGKNNAGVKSLEKLNEARILACTVNCMSAEIFNGFDMFENGIISVCNQIAASRNILPGMNVKEAIRNIQTS